MNGVTAYIESGILELYVLGNTTPQQKAEVEQMAVTHPAIAHEITAITACLHTYAQLNNIAPDPTIRPFLLATIDYSERIKNGEAVTFPPELNENTLISHFEPWLNRQDMATPKKLDDFYAKIIGYTDKMITAIIWLKQMAPQEVHTNEIEKFLIVEGTCDITIQDKVHHLKSGDMLSIPLYKNHFVKVTSAIACKIILQRVAA